MAHRKNPQLLLVVYDEDASREEGHDNGTGDAGRSPSTSANSLTSTLLPSLHWILSITTLPSEILASISGSAFLAVAAAPAGAQDEGEGVPPPPSSSSPADAAMRGFLISTADSMLPRALPPLPSCWSALSFSWSSFTYLVASERIVALSI